jgi:hypothetical protein
VRGMVTSFMEDFPAIGRAGGAVEELDGPAKVGCCNFTPVVEILTSTVYNSTSVSISHFSRSLLLETQRAYALPLSGVTSYGRLVSTLETNIRQVVSSFAFVFHVMPRHEGEARRDGGGRGGAQGRGCAQNMHATRHPTWNAIGVCVSNHPEYR